VVSTPNRLVNIGGRFRLSPLLYEVIMIKFTKGDEIKFIKPERKEQIALIEAAGFKAVKPKTKAKKK
jgi:hypothetical protein